MSTTAAATGAASALGAARSHRRGGESDGGGDRAVAFIAVTIAVAAVLVAAAPWWDGEAATSALQEIALAPEVPSIPPRTLTSAAAGGAGGSVTAPAGGIADVDGSSAETPHVLVNYPRLPPSTRGPGVQIWTEEELALYNGSDHSRPLLVAILGEVYDVGSGESHYGPAGAYRGFTGRDASRAFASGSFGPGEATAEVLGLDSEAIASILGWRTFYRQHETYRFVGLLRGRYYTAAGEPTPELAQVEDTSSQLERQEELRKQLQRRFPRCNMQHLQGRSHVDIWCDDSFHGAGTLPVHFQYVLPAMPGVPEERGAWCACLSPLQRIAAEEEAEQGAARPQVGVSTIRLSAYPECREGAQRCQRPPNIAPR